jgi:hypothetical protein
MISLGELSEEFEAEPVEVFLVDQDVAVALHRWQGLPGHRPGIDLADWAALDPAPVRLGGISVTRVASP